MNKIAGISYPKYNIFKKTDTEALYQFELDDSKKIEVGYKVFSDYPFLEMNHKNELILRKTNNSILFYEDCDHNRSREFNYNKKIVQCYTLLNGNYLLSTIDQENKHWLLLLHSNLEKLKEQQLGLTPWHSQDSIDEKDGVLMYSEYNVTKEPIKVNTDGNKFGNPFSIPNDSLS